MPTITFIQADGSRQQVAIKSGLTLMEGAVAAAVPGIIAECGGQLRLLHLPLLRCRDVVRQAARRLGRRERVTGVCLAAKAKQPPDLPDYGDRQLGGTGA